MAHASTARRSTPAVTVACSECGVDFSLSVRNELEHRKRGMPHRCRACRFAPRVSPEAIAEARRWWLRRFTLEELRSWPMF